MLWSWGCLKKNCSQTKYLLYHDMIFYGGLIANTCYKRTFSHCLMFHRERFGAINTNNESLVPIFDELTEVRSCQVASSLCCALSLSLSISRSLSLALYLALYLALSLALSIALSIALCACLLWLTNGTDNLSENRMKFDAEILTSRSKPFVYH